MLFGHRSTCTHLGGRSVRSVHLRLWCRLERPKTHSNWSQVTTTSPTAPAPSIMGYAFKLMPECESSSQQRVHLACAPVKLMRIYVNHSLQKWETISPKALHWTKGRKEQSRVEKIRGNNAFLFTLLTLHWIPLFTTARQNLLPIISILLRLIFFSSSGPWIYSLKLSLWKYFPGLWCNYFLFFLFIFLFYWLLVHQRTTTGKETKQWDQNLETCTYDIHLRKIKYKTKLILRLLKGETLQTKQDCSYKNAPLSSSFNLSWHHTSMTTQRLNDTIRHFMSIWCHKCIMLF